MKTIGNILWCLLGGFETALGYFSGGFVLMCTIVGIPFGLQLFKIGLVCLWPFGSHVTAIDNSGGCLSLLGNVLWFVFGGVYVLLAHFAFGLLWAITIVGIPFAKQHFKLAGLALHPFGRDINF